MWACVYLAVTVRDGVSDLGYLPQINGDLPDTGKRCCPGLGVKYPELYKAHYGNYPESWLTGIIKNTRTGYAADPNVRLSGASGGVITRVLQYLLETGRIDAAVLARQGIPTAMEASPVIADTPEGILESAGLLFNVPMLSIFR